MLTGNEFRDGLPVEQRYNFLEKYMLYLKEETMKIIIKKEILEKLHIVFRLQELRNEISGVPIDLDELAMKIECDPEILAEVLKSLGVSILKE